MRPAAAAATPLGIAPALQRLRDSLAIRIWPSVRPETNRRRPPRPKPPSRPFRFGPNNRLWLTTRNAQCGRVCKARPLHGACAAGDPLGLGFPPHCRCRRPLRTCAPPQAPHPRLPQDRRAAAPALARGARRPLCCRPGRGLKRRARPLRPPAPLPAENSPHALRGAAPPPLAASPGAALGARQAPVTHQTLCPFLQCNGPS
ncbi:MAG: hypothetical protein J3K34DRAFT_430308 [Monoraphidium minutum]|nr:MAG: hypothetical protein J3K34DRAFT_430308 [Monoraphidium minutum]